MSISILIVSIGVVLYLPGAKLGATEPFQSQALELAPELAPAGESGRGRDASG